MNWSPKAVIVLCFIQTFFILAGYLLAHCMVSFSHHVYDDMLGQQHINRLVQFIDSYGLWFMLVPLLWCIIATLLRSEPEGGSLSVTGIQVVTGILLTFLVAIGFSLGAILSLSLVF